ncbi:MAG TPA: thermonuclease family protein [Reyranella sp.]|nr:thermonuclease family protein [Reyranella sp.]
MKIIAAFALLASAALIAPAAAQTKPARNCGDLPATFDGLVFEGDGDTVYGMGAPHPFRLWGVQAPELRPDKKIETVAGMRARAAIDELLAGAHNHATAVPRKFDHWCRVVATVRLAEGPDSGKDLALELVRQGLGYGFWLADGRDPAESRAFVDAELQARAARLGLWKEWLGEKP